MNYRVLQRFAPTDAFADIPAERYRRIHTTEELKLTRLAQLSEVGELLGRGENWVSALRALQLQSKSSK